MIGFYNSVLKKEWERGEWDNEPDFLLYRDPETNFWCVIKRHWSMGFLCGYICVDYKHPYAYAHHDEYLEISIHGGFTYSGKCVLDEFILNIDGWWFGFDCGHYADLNPSEKYSVSSAIQTYKDFEFVRKELAGVAKKLLDIKQNL